MKKISFMILLMLCISTMSYQCNNNEDSAPVCGNGIIEKDEMCDGTPECRSDCSIDYSYSNCGDGIKQNSEECDDGNTVDGDSCSAICQTIPETCGNNIVEHFDGVESCDDGNAVDDGNGCGANCQIYDFDPPTVDLATLNYIGTPTGTGGGYTDGDSVTVYAYVTDAISTVSSVTFFIYNNADNSFSMCYAEYTDQLIAGTFLWQCDIRIYNAHLSNGTEYISVRAEDEWRNTINFYLNPSVSNNNYTKISDNSDTGVPLKTINIVAPTP